MKTGTMVILRGVPGAGKSYFAGDLMRAAHEENHTVTCSADYHFIRGAIYKFDPAQLWEAHNSCVREVIRAVHRKFHVIVDNTSITIAEIAPYVAIGQMYGYAVEIVSIVAPSAEIAAARNVHGVPIERIQAMESLMLEESKRIPPWWSHRVIEG